MLGLALKLSIYTHILGTLQRISVPDQGAPGAWGAVDTAVGHFETVCRKQWYKWTPEGKKTGWLTEQEVFMEMT
jgi:hypothetical protein